MTNRPQNTMSLFRRLPAWETVLVLLLAAIVVLNSQLSPYFLDVSNLFDSTLNFDEKAMIALPVALVIITGQIDVSVASIVSVCAVAMGLAANAGADGTLVVVAGLVTGLVAGLINGLLIAYTRIPPFIATLGMMVSARGVSNWYTKGQPVSFPTEPYTEIASGVRPVIIFLVIALIFQLIMRYTLYGRRTYAIGSNESAARVSA